MSEKFSNRFGYTPAEKEISIREDAPLGLRQFIVLPSYLLQPSDMRLINPMNQRPSLHWDI